MGDSRTRYMYLNLAYQLTHGAPPAHGLYERSYAFSRLHNVNNIAELTT